MSRLSLLRSIYLRTLRERRRSILSWGIGMALLVALIAAAFPAIRDQPAFADMLANYPEPVLAIMGIDPETTMTTATGYLDIELFQFMLPLMFLIISVGMGASAIAGEEDSGTIDLLMSMPKTRSRVYFEKLFGMVTVTIAIGTILAAVLIASVEAMAMDIRPDFVAGAVLNVVLLALFFGALAYGLGAATGRRSLALGITTMVAVSAYFLNSLAPMIEGLERARQASPFYYYAASKPLKNGLDPAHVSVLLGGAVIFALIGLIGFRRRDLG